MTNLPADGGQGKIKQFKVGGCGTKGGGVSLILTGRQEWLVSQQYSTMETVQNDTFFFFLFV